MAIVRRTGFGKKIVIGDKNIANAEAISKIMNDAGFDTVPMEMDLSSRKLILERVHIRIASKIIAKVRFPKHSKSSLS